MADTSEVSFQGSRDANAVESLALRRIPTRLTGDLAVGTVIALSAEADEIVKCHGASRMRVVFKVSGTGIPRLRLIPLLADGAAEAVTSIQTATPGAATEGVASFDLYGETAMKVEVAETGGGASITIVYVDVYLL